MSKPSKPGLPSLKRNPNAQPTSAHGQTPQLVGLAAELAANPGRTAAGALARDPWPEPSNQPHTFRARARSGTIPQHEGFGLAADIAAEGQPSTSARVGKQRATQRMLQNLAGQDSSAPYGLAVELAQEGHVHNPLRTQPEPAARHGAKRAINMQLAEAGHPWPMQQQQQQPWQPSADPMQQQHAQLYSAGPAEAAAASHEINTEPDYGIVAELKSLGPADPLHSRDFGLAAEVTRRRTGRAASTGGLSLLRPRKRLAAVGPPADFGLAEELQQRQAQAELDRLDPFNAANRATKQDPFVMADDIVKFPTMPYTPHHPQEQEIVDGPVPVKVPPSGASETSAVSGDDNQYGLSYELGVNSDEAHRQWQLALQARDQQLDVQGPPLPVPEWAPPGFKFIYNPETGLLENAEGAAGEGGKLAKEYIEDVATGDFYKLHNPGVWRRITKALRRKQGPSDPDEEEEIKGFRGGLRNTARNLSNFFSMLGIFVQGLLGGFALLNFFMTYLVYSKNGLKDFLMYYSHLAELNNRVYYSLITLSLIASVSRFARDQLRGFQPAKMYLRAVDLIQILLYCAAYTTSVLCTPFDDQLSYEYARNPHFWQLTFNNSFKKQLALFHLLNIARTACAGIAWAITCYQQSPRVFAETVRVQVNNKVKRALQPSYRVAPEMAMAADFEDKAAAAAATVDQDIVCKMQKDSAK